MDALHSVVDEVIAEPGLSGVVRIDLDGQPVVERAAGLAHRGLGVPNTISTQFGTASAAKGFTALVVMSMVEAGQLTLATTARSLLGADLPLIDDAVTVEHLLTHRSGIGDYLDEEVEQEPDAYLMPVPVHRLATTTDYLQVLAGLPQKFPPGERFTYCNGAFVVLALLAERASGVEYHELVQQRVCAPAGLADTAFLRSDELPGRAAIGYLGPDGLRNNLLHLPVRGNGDGGIYTTVADVHRLWAALLAGRIVGPQLVADMLRVHTEAPGEDMEYGLGFWLHTAAPGAAPAGGAGTGESGPGSVHAVELHGFDVGATFVSVHDLRGRYTFTVVTNTSRGAWAARNRLLAALNEHL